MKHLRTFESYNINENTNIIVKVNNALEDNPEKVFDIIGMDLPSSLDGVEYENKFDEARKKAVKFFNRNPDMLKNIE